MTITEIRQLIIPNTKEGVKLADGIEEKSKKQGMFMGRSNGNEIIVSTIFMYDVEDEVLEASKE